jgi:hypothetical protein
MFARTCENYWSRTSPKIIFEIKNNSEIVFLIILSPAALLIVERTTYDKRGLDRFAMSLWARDDPALRVKMFGRKKAARFEINSGV